MARKIEINQTATCRHCRGTGVRDGETCSTCEGSGIVNVHKLIYITITPAPADKECSQTNNQ